MVSCKPAMLNFVTVHKWLNWFYQFLLVVLSECLQICQCMYWPNLPYLMMYSFSAYSGHPDTMWSTVWSVSLQMQHIGSVPSFIILAFYTLVWRLWPCTAMMNPTASPFKLELLSDRLVAIMSISGSLKWVAYLPCKCLACQLSSMLFRYAALAFIIILWEVSVTLLSSGETVSDFSHRYISLVNFGKEKQ